MLTSRINDIRVWQEDSSGDSCIPEYLLEKVSSGTPIKPMLRRRLSDVGRIAAGLVIELSQGEALPVVWCSRYGDTQRLARILTSLADSEDISPTDFSLSVHNAQAGITSMSMQNHSPFIAVSGGMDRIYSAILEAESLRLSLKQDVLLVFCDQPLPALYQPFQIEDNCPHVTVIRLSSQGRKLEITSVTDHHSNTSPNSALLASFNGQWMNFGEGNRNWKVRVNHE